MTGWYALWLVASYLIGAIPTSFIVGRLARGIDLREHGSMNLGATNLYRLLGWKYALPVALFDIAKGAVPVLLFAPRASPSQAFAMLCGLTAVAGHVFSVFVRFKGGKGVATAAGAMLGLAPGAIGISAGLWGLLVYLTGYVSVASIVAALALPVGIYALQPGNPALFGMALALAVAIVWLHRVNIRRLRAGTESRFRRSAPAGRTGRPPR